MFKKASDILSDYYYFQADINGNSSAPGYVRHGEILSVARRNYG